MDTNTSVNARKISGKVLLVEDDATFGPWLYSKLVKEGLEVQLCVDLDSAKKVFGERVFHAVVTDIYFGRETPDGLDLVKTIESAGTPVIVISSRADLHIAKESMNHGAAFLLEKPFEAQELLTVLKRIWEEPRGLQALVERFLDINQLTPKEKEIVRLLLKGLSNKEIAMIGDNSDRTIKFHLTAIFEKCGVKSRTELINAILPT